MGVGQALTHWLIKFAVRYILLLIALYVILGPVVAQEKLGLLGLTVFVVTLIDGVIASLLLRGYRGY
jgi:hypothetical protein